MHVVNPCLPQGKKMVFLKSMPHINWKIYFFNQVNGQNKLQNIVICGKYNFVVV